MCGGDYSPHLHYILGLLKEMRLVRFEVFTAVTMKNGVFWDVMPCGSRKNRRFGGTYRGILGISSQSVSVASCS
jgi:hypothetical protein